MTQELMDALHARGEIPEYPVWISDSIAEHDTFIDIYFVTKLDGEPIAINMIVDKIMPHYTNIYLSRITEDGFRWRGANMIVSKYFENRDEGIDYRDYLLTNLPAVLMLVALR